MSQADDPRDEELSALYRATQEEMPSAGLDARILAAARAAATPPREVAPPARPVSWTQRWRIPVALAATVLMTATLTLLVREHEVDGIAPHASKPQAAQARKEAVPSAPAPAPAPAAAPAPERRSAVPARDTAVESIAPKDRLADHQPSVSAKRAGPPPAQPSAAPPAALAAPAAARADHAAESMQAERASGAGKRESGPEQWLAEIRRLRSEGRATEAAARLAAFEKRYPQFPLPEDMKQP